VIDVVMWESDDREAALKTILGYARKNVDTALHLLIEARAMTMGLLPGAKDSDYEKISNAYELGRLEEDAELIEEALKVAKELGEAQGFYDDVLYALEALTNAYYDIKAGKPLSDVQSSIEHAERALKYALVDFIDRLGKKIVELQGTTKDNTKA
jgi:tetratricopeptide (TPR) repeat protein